MTSKPLISIIIPVYNAEQYLDYCVESVLKQTYTNFELLLIDDGSTDLSPSLCDAYAADDDRVVVIHKPNGGVSSARNVGIENSQGEYMLFIDNDDALPFNALEVYVSKATETDYDIIQGKIDVWNKETTQLDEVKDIHTISLSIDRYVTNSTNRTWVWGKMYKAAVAKQYRYPEGHYCEDLFFNAMYFTDSHVKNAAVIDVITYLRYENPKSASHLWKVENFLDNILVVDEIYERVTQRTVDHRIQDQYLKLFYVQLCRCKYSIILRDGYDAEAKSTIRKRRRIHLTDLAKCGLSIQYKIALFVCSFSNSIFRQWMIHDDPTMKDYEKQFHMSTT